MDVWIIRKYFCYFWFVTCCIQQSDAVHYTSDWMLIQSQTLGPFTIDHGLGEYPAKVDVQINVTKNGNQFIFSGIGTAQRDDDRDKMYGGVVYTYNDKHVKLYVPKSTDTASYTDKGRLVFTGASVFTGPFQANFHTAYVRIRAWRVCDFPPANFTSNGIHQLNSNVAASSFVEIPHSLGDWPHFVVVQFMTSDGYMFEAEGSVFVDKITYYGGSTMVSRLCGAVYGVNNQNFRLWVPYNTNGFAVSVFCVVDGWGKKSLTFNSGTAYIKAWILDASHVLYKQTQVLGKGINTAGIVQLGQDFTIDKYITNVQVKSRSSNGYMFPATGSVMSDGSFGDFGGVLYGYKKNRVLLWRPADTRIDGHMIYVGGLWGNGVKSIQQDTADVIISILYFASSESCGSTCLVNQSNSNCDCTSGIERGPVTLQSTPLHLSVVPGSSIPPVSCNDSMYTTLFSVKTPQFHFYDLQFKVNVTNTYREKASALQIKNLSILSMGKNIKCVNMTSTIQSTPNSWTAHLHVWNFGTPYKQTTSSADDEMVLQVDFLPDKSTIHLKDTFSIWSEIDCIYNGLLSSSYQTSTTVYLGSEINETLHTNYSFAIENGCMDDCIGQGDSIEFLLKISAERDKCHAPFELHFPFLSNSSAKPQMAICDYKVIKIGRNFPCLAEDDIHPIETILDDGRIDTVRMQFPRLCNFKLFDDLSDDTIVIQIRVMLRDQDVFEYASPEAVYCVDAVIDYNHTHTCYGLQIRQRATLPFLSVVEGIVIPFGQTFITANRSLLRSVDGSTHTQLPVSLSLHSINSTTEIYDFSPPVLATTVILTRSYQCLAGCCIQSQFRSKNIADYFQVYNDPTDVILKDIKVLLDEHNDSCMSLPKYGDTPPVFWIKMNLTILLGTLKPSFTLTLHGERLLCNRHGGKSSLQVSIPSPNVSGGAGGRLKYCDLERSRELPNGTISSCQFQCSCNNVVECTEAFIFISIKSDDNWSLCEIAAS